jgi:hypothetical protein
MLSVALLFDHRPVIAASTLRSPELGQSHVPSLGHGTLGSLPPSSPGHHP